MLAFDFIFLKMSLLAFYLFHMLWNKSVYLSYYGHKPWGCLFCCVSSAYLYIIPDKQLKWNSSSNIYSSSIKRKLNFQKALSGENCMNYFILFNVIFEMGLKHLFIGLVYITSVLKVADRIKKYNSNTVFFSTFVFIFICGKQTTYCYNCDNLLVITRYYIFITKS